MASLDAVTCSMNSEESSARARLETSLQAHSAALLALEALRRRMEDRNNRLQELWRSAQLVLDRIDAPETLQVSALPAPTPDALDQASTPSSSSSRLVPPELKIPTSPGVSPAGPSPAGPSPSGFSDMSMDSPAVSMNAKMLSRPQTWSDTPLGTPFKSALASPDGNRHLGRSVSFGADEKWSWEDGHADVQIFPAHGHWVPQELLERRNSFQEESARRFGGRQILLRIEDKPVRCFLVEPMGKLLSPGEYVSTGLVICLQGAGQTKKSIDEWVQVLKRTKLLDSGISVAFPELWQESRNKQAAEHSEETAEEVDEAVAASAPTVEEVESVLEAILSETGADSCVLCGKFRGAQTAVEAAAAGLAEGLPGKGLLAGRLAGLVLLAPESPAPREACQVVPCPVMLLWAQDDKVANFREHAESWAVCIGSRTQAGAVAVFRDPSVGGHDLARVLRKHETAAADMLHFVVSCLLCAILDGLAISSQTGDAAWAPGATPLPDSLIRLCEDMPAALGQELCKDREGSADGAGESDQDEGGSMLLRG
eukprot:TRINITY_DN11159_c0_g1_i2.p1 TRINITY_DN11159_c0_g1~~TRINITY_DN11159_c0_g1_i2.p1  ORF type:complete len:549 (-),score=94.63 TRINITY_DN11159_c0_g1_i2:239-1861(-)